MRRWWRDITEASQKRKISCVLIRITCFQHALGIQSVNSEGSRWPICFILAMIICLKVISTGTKKLRFLGRFLFSRVLHDSMTRYIGRSVRLSPFAFFGVYGRFLHYCYCPLARDFGSRVYGLV